MKNIKLPKVETNEIQIFNDLEIKKITDYCLEKKNKYLGILICLYTGIRIGELLALTYDDIDYKEKILSINKTISYIKKDDKYQLVISSPKTKNSKRKIPLPKIILKLLGKKDPSIPIISNKNESFISPRQYQDTYKRLLKKIGIEYKSFHCLRHTFASYALKTGVDIKTLSLLLGHSNVSITLNRYCHVSLEMKKNAIDRICNCLYSNN